MTSTPTTTTPGSVDQPIGEATDRTTSARRVGDHPAATGPGRA